VRSNCDRFAIRILLEFLMKKLFFIILISLIYIDNLNANSKYSNLELQINELKEKLNKKNDYYDILKLGKLYLYNGELDKACKTVDHKSYRDDKYVYSQSKKHYWPKYNESFFIKFAAQCDEFLKDYGSSLTILEAGLNKFQIPLNAIKLDGYSNKNFRIDILKDSPELKEKFKSFYIDFNLTKRLVKMNVISLDKKINYDKTYAITAIRKHNITLSQSFIEFENYCKKQTSDPECIKYLQDDPIWLEIRDNHAGGKHAVFKTIWFDFFKGKIHTNYWSVLRWSFPMHVEAGGQLGSKKIRDKFNSKENRKLTKLFKKRVSSSEQPFFIDKSDQPFLNDELRKIIKIGFLVAVLYVFSKNVDFDTSSSTSFNKTSSVPSKNTNIFANRSIQQKYKILKYYRAYGF